LATHVIETVRLLVVSREPSVLRPIHLIGESNGWHLETAMSAWEALEQLQNGTAANLLLLELTGNNGDGLHMLRWVRRVRPDVPIVLIAPQGDIENEQEALRMGARAVLLRPVDKQLLESVIRRELGLEFAVDEADIGSEDVEALGDGTFFVAASPIMRKLRAQVELLAQTDLPVLLVGESGSGKSATANLIHGLSVRAGLKLLKANCGALPGHLLEEELFGCSKGENGFSRTRTGKLELADKSTLLLDEVAEMPPDLQHSLAQVLQNKRLPRPGKDRPVEIDVRILASTSDGVDHLVTSKRIREDLYHRLSAFTLHVPPLRQRREEIPLLLHHFMQQVRKHYGLPARRLTPAVVDACQHHSWPGNLDELEKFVKRYLVIPDHELASAHELVPRTNGEATHSVSRPAASAVPIGDGSNPVPESLKSLVQSVRTEAERNAIIAALQKTGWNRKAAARMIKVSYRTLLYKIDQYQLRPSNGLEIPETHSSETNGKHFNGNGTTH
jgi:two-component system, NtrC family, response regulator AtoC